MLDLRKNCEQKFFPRRGALTLGVNAENRLKLMFRSTRPSLKYKGPDIIYREYGAAKKHTGLWKFSTSIVQGLKKYYADFWLGYG